jgi:hypothetical protein
MPQFSPLWFLNTISWTFAILSLLIYLHQSLTFPAFITLQLSRFLLLCESLFLAPQDVPSYIPPLHTPSDYQLLSKFSPFPLYKD